MQKDLRQNILLLTVSVSLIFLLSEVGLRALGYKPGKHTYTDWYKEVDTLVDLKGRIADEAGITIIDTSLCEPIHDYLVACAKQKTVLPSSFTPDEYFIEIPYTAEKCAPLAIGNSKSSLKNYVLSLEESDSLSELQKAIKTYQLSPVNHLGFRSIPFTDYPKAKKILLIGDSFVYGYSADDFSNCFADILLSKQYAVYNTGISGTDPPQYEAVAKKYIPVLKPDYVFVNLYLGNDVMYYDEPVRPFLKSHFATNSADFSSSPYGIPFSNSKEIYDFINSCCYIPSEKNLFNSICSKSCVGTLFWVAIQKMQHLNPYNDKVADFQKKVGTKKSDIPFTNSYVENIKSICAENNSACFICCIPQADESGLHFADEFENFLPDKKFLQPTTLNREDYKHGSDTHFNNSGHRKYAEFLTALIDSFENAKVLQ